MNHPGQSIQLHRQRDRFLPLIEGPQPARDIQGLLPSRVAPVTATLVYADTAKCSDILVAELTRLGKRTFTVRHPLEAIRLLEDPGVTIEAAFMSLQDASSDVVRLFAFLQEEYWGVRRIAFAQHDARYANPPALQSCAHQMILWDPWDRTSFGDLLEDALNSQQVRSESSWSDIRLFKSQHGTNRTAIAALIQRYRHRIGHLVADATRNTADAEDIVQDTCLDIVRLLPSFDAVCSPGEWVDRVTRSCIRSFGKRRSIGNMHHRSAIVRGSRGPAARAGGALCA
jgi:hypothetical protein